MTTIGSHESYTVRSLFWILGLPFRVVSCSGFQESRVEAGSGMFVPDILVHFYRLPVCQSRIWASWSSETVTRTYLVTFSGKTLFAFITMMHSTALGARQRSYPRWIVLTKTKPPTLLVRQTDIGNEACDILLSSTKAARVCQMNEEIAEVVSSFRSNSILQMKLLDKIAKCPGHPDLRLRMLSSTRSQCSSLVQPML
jgi:hypothetical protein